MMFEGWAHGPNIQTLLGRSVMLVQVDMNTDIAEAASCGF